MKIDKLVCSMSHLKCKLVLLHDFDKERYNLAYIDAIDILINQTGNVEKVLAEYEYFKSLVS